MKPYNLSSYALLLLLVADMCGLEADEIIFTGGDTHIYSNHVEQCKTLLEREPYDLPKLVMPDIPKGSTKEQLEFLMSLSADDFKLVGYKYHPKLVAKMAV
ncbi:thymidylate synthase [Pseudomonas phage PspYZU05]|uniref:dTMP thymidylate synthase n=1 Tax=Pseudomonas phage PspYZU05 TaxID=1983556 RepID=A0A2U7N2C7_9CAUD|nr:thymidylate synthase [Pseudomonas phage PspYZU05]ASD51970.1 dTMP thymidylate synthase [Pseudomonas phage PspYZU05]